MKIAITSAYLGQIARGCETWAADLARELHNRKLDVTLFKGGGVATLPYEQVVFCPDHRRPIWKCITRLTRHGGGWRLGLGNPLSLQQTGFALAMIRPLRRGGYDILHTQDPYVAVILQWANHCGLHHAKVILGHGTEEPFEFLQRLDHVQELAPWHLVQDRAKGLPASRLWFSIPNFVDCDVFHTGNQIAARREFSIPEDRFVVLDVAALKLTHKRLDWLGQEIAIARQPHPEIMLVVAGAATDETPQVVAALVKSLGENVLILKDLPHNKMSELYRAADLFAHTSLFEMMAIVLIEALATGLTVRAHCHPVLDWVINGAGETVDMQQRGALAASIIGCIENPNRRHQRSISARLQALKKFDQRPVVDMIMEMYRQVMDDKGPKSKD